MKKSNPKLRRVKHKKEKKIVVEWKGLNWGHSRVKVGKKIGLKNFPLLVQHVKEISPNHIIIP